MKKIKSVLKKEKKKDILVDYQKIWLENGGELIKIDKHKYYKLHHSQKNLEEIPSQKRSMYKKRFAMLEEIKVNLDKTLDIQD
ncbi:LapB [Campylobacter jejuni]|uniref:LapB n=1 Tax=Campylobacter jejuni TaxID=197 RepID=A0AAX2LX43_CAMJU|nr:LapB [Campylobacter jejuni]